MSEVHIKNDVCHFPARGLVQHIAANRSDEWMATSSVDKGDAFVQVWGVDRGGKAYGAVSTVQVASTVTQLAWAHPESGPLVACASASGVVFILEAPRPGDVPEKDQQGAWRRNADLKPSSANITHVCFAPPQYGLLLSVASEDGNVYIYEADRLMAPNSWSLQGKIEVSDARSGGCRCVSWHGFSAGVAPLLVAAAGDAVTLWQYNSSLMAWEKVASLAISAPGSLVTGLHWAPTLGRPVDLLAASHGSTVDIFTLQGASSALQSQLLDSLQHEASVSQVEFNLLGTCLAVATEDNKVFQYVANFAGAWTLLVVLEGDAELADGDEPGNVDMLDIS